MSLPARHARSVEIVGDGPAACVAAIVLARRGWSVRLLVRVRSGPRRPRIDVLGASALATLLRLGLSRGEVLAVARECPGTWCRWDGDEGISNDYLTTPHGSAWAVDRTAFDALLRTHAADAGAFFVAEDLNNAAALGTAATRPLGDQEWRIIACGCLGARSGSSADAAHDDRLVGIVAVGEGLPGLADERLTIESLRDAWAYGVAGPGGLVGLGILTDARALAGRSPCEFALSVLGTTERIADVVARLRVPPAFQALPVPCRWLPLAVAAGILRIGDAHASFDPLSGRGLWETIRRSEEVALALDACPGELASIQERSWIAYQRYRADRHEAYRAARDRFRTAFWNRRCRPPPAPSRSRTGAGS